MTKVLTLFDMGKLAKRQTPEEEKFLTNNEALIRCYDEAVDYAFDMLHRKVFTVFKPHFMDNKLPAIAVSSFIREYLIDKMPVQCRNADHARFKLTTDTGEFVYVKKLDENLLPMNIQTEANDLILYQLTTSGSAAPGNIYFGYQTDQGFPYVKSKYVVCIDGSKLLWKKDIADLRVSGKFLKIAAHKSTQLKAGVVKLKKGKTKGKE